MGNNESRPSAFGGRKPVLPQRTYQNSPLSQEHAISRKDSCGITGENRKKERHILPSEQPPEINTNKPSPSTPTSPHDRDRSSSPEVALMSLKRSGELAARVALRPRQERVCSIGHTARATGAAGSNYTSASSSAHTQDGASSSEDTTGLRRNGAVTLTAGVMHPVSPSSSRTSRLNFFREPRFSTPPASYTVLPLGWYRARDENDSTYFYTAGGKAQWARPTQPADVAVLAVAEEQVRTGEPSSNKVAHSVTEIAVIPVETTGDDQEKEGVTEQGDEGGDGGEVGEKLEDVRKGGELEKDLESASKERKKKKAKAAGDVDKSASKGKGKAKEIVRAEGDKEKMASKGKSKEKMQAEEDTDTNEETGNGERKRISWADYRKRKEKSNAQPSGSKSVPDTTVPQTHKSAAQDTRNTGPRDRPRDAGPSTQHHPSIPRRRTASRLPRPSPERAHKRVRFDFAENTETPPSKRGRPCYFWNEGNCWDTDSKCRFSHVCSGCGSRSHPRIRCDDAGQATRAEGAAQPSSSRRQFPPPSPERRVSPSSPRRSLGSERRRKKDVYDRR